MYAKVLIAKVLIFEKKKSVHQLDSSPQPRECKSVALPIEPYGYGIMLEFSPLLRLQPAAEHNLITEFTCGDKLEVGK